MKATLVFQSNEPYDISIGMVFIPCICWVVGGKIILNPHSSNPHYLKGDFQYLLQCDYFKRHSYFENLKSMGIKKVAVILHDVGHGTQGYIDLLIEDIKSENYKVEIIRLF